MKKELKQEEVKEFLQTAAELLAIGLNAILSAYLKGKRR